MLRQRFNRFFCAEVKKTAGIVRAVSQYRPRVVIGLGVHAPIMLSTLPPKATRCRIWYAADELMNFHLSCLRREPLADIPKRLAKLMLYGAMENLFARRLDGAIGVSPKDATLLHWIGGARRTITIRNGVDMNRFSPPPETPPPQAWTSATPALQLTSTTAPMTEPNTLVFWGHGRFEPNIDAVCWFAKHVWMRLIRETPSAKWRIIGRDPHPRIRALSTLSGIEIVGAVSDIRPLAHSATITILPMRCGGGIKNKLLEAAAMARPIVASPQTLRGLTFERSDPPALICRNPAEWTETIVRVWSDPTLARHIGQSAYRWVSKHYRWSSAARTLVGWLDDLLSESDGASRAGVTRRLTEHRGRAA